MRYVNTVVLFLGKDNYIVMQQGIVVLYHESRNIVFLYYFSLRDVRFDMQMNKDFCPVMNSILSKILQKGSSMIPEEEFYNIEDLI